jgi:3-hydroxyisobutyrate dehydrogenase-like beta-hydroxyacid dehydrogenase
MSGREDSLGIVGLGSMGGHMARRLLAAGWDLTVCDTRPEVVKEFTDLGAKAAGSPRETADLSDVVLFSLPRPEDVKAVALGPDGVVLGSRASIVIDLSTTGAAMAKEVGAALAEVGKTLVDAPVSGGPRGAENGTLCIMVAGEESACERVADVLDELGGEVVRLGPEPGQGQMMKVINNMISASAFSATLEGLLLGAKADLGPDEMVRVLNASTARNTHTEDKIPRCILTGNFDFGFKLDLMLKDIRLCLALADELEMPMWVSNSVRQLFAIAVHEGGGPGQDITEIVRPLETWAGTELRGRESLVAGTDGAR